jgi:DNA-binding phage protein
MREEKKSRPYKEFLYERLENPEEAAAYLNAALEDEDPTVFLIALRDIAQANGGMNYYLQNLTPIFLGPGRG